MNPFVNPNKRSVTLPKGCKDLVDVLNGPETNRDEAIRRFILLVLAEAQQEHVNEVIIGSTSSEGYVPVKYNVKGTWKAIPAFPNHVRPDAVSELVRMAKFHNGEIPGEGVLDENFGKLRLRWVVAITSAQGECTLVRVQD